MMHAAPRRAGGLALTLALVVTLVAAALADAAPPPPRPARCNPELLEAAAAAAAAEGGLEQPSPAAVLQLLSQEKGEEAVWPAALDGSPVRTSTRAPVVRTRPP